MGHGQPQKSELKTTILQDILVEEIVEPPPPKLISKFITVEDWLTNICDNNKPKIRIAKYRFGLFESKNDYTLFLAGLNTYKVGKKRSSTQIEFEPKNMYFKLPEGYYKSLTREQLLKKLSSDLKAFTNSTKFKNSFFIDANIVAFDTNGTTLWTKE